MAQVLTDLAENLMVRANQKKFGEIADRQKRVKVRAHSKGEKLRQYRRQWLANCPVMIIGASSWSKQLCLYI